MKTQVKGDIGVIQAIAKLNELGYTISIPLTESAPYDLIAEKDGEMKRIQVKYITGIQVDLRRIHSNSSGYVVKYYKDHFDWLFVYKGDGTCYLIKEDLSNRRTINPQKEHQV